MLEEALGWTNSPPRHTVLLIKDSVAASGSFLLHYLLNKVLASPDAAAPNPLVIFVGLNEPFSHYNKVARKQGCNLAAFRDNGAVVFIDMLVASPIQQETCTSIHNSTTDIEACCENKLFQLYQRFQKLLRREPGRCAWIFIDDLSLLEVVAEGDKNQLLNFVHYCRALACNKQCSLVLLAHQDVFQSSEEIVMANQLEYWSDIVINVISLATGHASDVHGQIIIEHRTSEVECGTASSMTSNLRSNLHYLHYKVMENTVLFFSPGRQA